MPFYINQNDGDDALWVTECPARCITVKLLYSEREKWLAGSLGLSSECLPSFWERLRFSLELCSPSWRSACHRQEMVVDGDTLRRLRDWLSSHMPGDSEEAETSPEAILFSDEVEGGLDITFEVEKRRGFAFDLVMGLRPIGDYDCWFGFIQSGGRGRWRLAWDNVFNKKYVEQWPYLDLSKHNVEMLIAWIDEALAKFEDGDGKKLEDEQKLIKHIEDLVARETEARYPVVIEYLELRANRDGLTKE
jgi:hypothetical protein